MSPRPWNLRVSFSAGSELRPFSILKLPRLYWGCASGLCRLLVKALCCEYSRCGRHFWNQALPTVTLLVFWPVGYLRITLCSRERKKKALKVGSQLSECIERPHATFMDLSLYSFKIRGLLMFICVNELTKSNSEYQWPLWGTLELSRLQFSPSVVSDSLWPHEWQHRPGLPVHHQLPEFTQTHVHRVGDAMQTPHSLSSPSPPALNPPPPPASGSFPMSQLFTWGGQSIGVSASASVLPMNTLDWSPLGWTG